jgi:hypothetical protein
MNKNNKKSRYEAPRLSDFGTVPAATQGVDIGQPEPVGTDLFLATVV